MSYNLYLDDFRVPRDSYDHSYQPIYISVDWEIVRSYDEFVKIIQEKGIPEIVSFDHDLADAHYEQPTHINYEECKEKTGFHCAKWLINYCIDNKKEIPAMILVHSLNPAGTLNIRSLFNTYYKYMRI